MIGAPGPIIDPYMGRGTTAFAAWRAGRSSIGADLYPATVQLARDWLATMGVPTGSIRVARPVRSVA